MSPRIKTGLNGQYQDGNQESGRKQNPLKLPFNSAWSENSGVNVYVLEVIGSLEVDKTKKGAQTEVNHN